MKFKNILGISALTLLLGFSVSGMSVSAAPTTLDNHTATIPIRNISGKISADPYLQFQGVGNVNTNNTVNITSQNGGDIEKNRRFTVAKSGGITAKINNNTGHKVPAKLFVNETTTKADDKTPIKSHIYNSQSNNSQSNLLDNEVGTGNNINPNIGDLSVQIDPSASISNTEQFNTTLTWSLTDAQGPTNNGNK